MRQNSLPPGTPHPSEEVLLACCEAPEGAEAVRVREHLAGCPECGAWVSSMRALLDFLKAPHLEHAPEPTVARAIRVITQMQAEEAGRAAASSQARPRESLGRKASRILEEIRFALVFDSALHGAAQGVRAGADPSGPRQVLFESPGSIIRLQISHDPDSKGRSSILGQLLGPDPSGAVAQLQRDKRKIKTGISADGYFRFEKVPSGRVRVRIEARGRAFTTEAIDL